MAGTGIVNLDIGKASDLVTAVGGLAGQIRSAITGDLSPEAKAALEQAALTAEQAVDTAQAAVNAADAASTSFFRAGWRPAVGWVCALAVFYTFLVVPIGGRILGGVWPAVDINALWPLMAGMLGVTTARTVEKIKGIA